MKCKPWWSVLGPLQGYRSPAGFEWVRLEVTPFNRLFSIKLRVRPWGGVTVTFNAKIGRRSALYGHPCDLDTSGLCSFFWHTSWRQLAANGRAFEKLASAEHHSEEQ